MKFSSTAIATLAIATPSGRAWGFLAEQEQDDREHTFARSWCGPRPSPPTEPSPSALPSTAPVEDPSVPSCMPEFENFDEVCENRLQFKSLVTPSCRTPCDEWEGLPEANFVLSSDICNNCISDENGDEYCIETSREDYVFIHSPNWAWDELVGERFTLHQSGSLSSGSTVQFLRARNYSAYKYNQAVFPKDYVCRVVVDGVECNSCTFFYNTTLHLWWDVDCSNTPSVDSPTRVDLDSHNLHREPTIGYDHPLFAITDRAFNGICYNRWFPEEEQAPSAAPVEDDCVPTSGFDQELCEWYNSQRGYRGCLNPCDDWVGEIRSNIAFHRIHNGGCYAGDNGEEYCVEKDYITYYLSRDFNASAAAEWPYSWPRMELGTSERFNQTGLASSGAVVEYIMYAGVWPVECDIKIDGQLCNSCNVYYEEDFVGNVIHKVLTVDCSNVDGVDAAVSFNLTRDYDRSYALEFYRGLLEPEVSMDHPLFALTARVQHNDGRFVGLLPIDEAPTAAPVEGDCDPESGYDEVLCNARLGGNCANPCDDWPGEIRSNIVRYAGWYECSGCLNEGEEDEYCLDLTDGDYYLSFGFNASDPSWNPNAGYLSLGFTLIFNSSGISSHGVTLTYDNHDSDACWVTLDGEYCDSCVKKYFRTYPVQFDGIEVDCRNLGIGNVPFQFNYWSLSNNWEDPEVPMNHPLFALTNRARFGVCEGLEEGRLPPPVNDNPAVINDQDRQHRPFMPWRRFGNIHPDEGGRV